MYWQSLKAFKKKKTNNNIHLQMQLTLHSIHVNIYDLIFFSKQPYDKNINNIASFYTMENATYSQGTKP